VKASQPTVSRKISRLLDQGILEVAISTQDRRVPIYNLSERIRVFLRQSEIMNDIFP
jgi:DNA-binding MarR family transcriptional regulator